MSRCGRPGRSGKPGKPGKSGRPGKPGRSGKPGKRGRPGKKGKNGRSGKSGVPGKSGKVPGPDTRPVRRAKIVQKLLAWILATLPSTVSKFHGSSRGAECQEALASHAGPYQGKPMFQIHSRLEGNHRLDLASLELYNLGVLQGFGPAYVAAAWLLRAVLCGSQRLPRVIMAYQDATRESLLDAIKTQNVCDEAMEKALDAVTLGSATALSRVSLWNSLCGKNFAIRVAAARVFTDLVNGGRFHSTCSELEHAHTEAHAQDILRGLHLHNKFLRYLVYRDIRLFCKALPPSHYVGPGSEVLLRKATGRGCAVALKKLTRSLVADLPAKWANLVWPQGFDVEDTEHNLCELRRFEDHEFSKKGRRRDADLAAVQNRAELRQAYFARVRCVLGFD